MPEKLNIKTGEEVDDTVESEETSRSYSAPELRRLGGGLVEKILGSSPSTTPDVSTQFYWGDEEENPES